jgi:hypothetical protein
MTRYLGDIALKNCFWVSRVRLLGNVEVLADSASRSVKRETVCCNFEKSFKFPGDIL